MAFEELHRTNQYPALMNRVLRAYAPDRKSWIDTTNVVSSNFNILGMEQRTFLNRTKNFRPGVFSVNPIDSRVVSWDCSPTSCTLYERYTGVDGIKRLYLNRVISGPIAAFFANPVGNTVYGVTRDTSEGLLLSQAESRISQPDVDIGVIIGEAGDTIRMLTNPIRALTKEVSNFLSPKHLRRPSKFRIPRGAKATSELANRWMEYRYGMLPLMADIEGLLKLAYGLLSWQTVKTPLRKRGRRATPSRTTTEYDFVSFCSGGFYGKGHFVRQDYTDVMAHIYYTIIDWKVYQRYKLGLAGPQIASLIWELIPYSFVVDWFVNVGDMIRSLTPNPSIQILGNCVGTHSSSDTNISLSMASIYSDMSDASPCPSVYTASTKKFVRTCNIPLSGGTPSLDLSFNNFKHVVDSAAMLWQKIPKLSH